MLDTSVAVAWYLEGVFSPSARVWQERRLTGKVALFVPLLHYWEFENVLQTLVHRRELPEDLAREIYELHMDAPLERGEPEEKNVLDIALHYRATAYDAGSISLCLSRDMPLITAEKTTTPRVTKLRNRLESVR